MEWHLCCTVLSCRLVSQDCWAHWSLQVSKQSWTLIKKKDKKEQLAWTHDYTQSSLPPLFWDKNSILPLSGDPLTIASNLLYLPICQNSQSTSPYSPGNQITVVNCIRPHLPEVYIISNCSVTFTISYRVLQSGGYLCQLINEVLRHTSKLFSCKIKFSVVFI